MRICFIVHNLNTTNGGGRFSNDLVLNLKNKGFEIEVITAENTRPLLNFFMIRRVFKSSDIIHVIDVWPNGFYARLISLGLKKPIVITALGTYSVKPFYSWQRLLMKWTCHSIQLVAISDYTKEKILEIIPDINIKVISPGFDLDFWSGDSIVSEKILRLKPYILSVGALKSRKGYLGSIKAFAAVVKKIENLNYVIIGQCEESDYVRNIKEIIKENSLENRVFFVSSGIDDNTLLGFYRNAELFTLIPVEEDHHFEGFGIVYLEAAASGLPIVATYNSGATSATKDGYNSILVPQNNSQKTADAIIKILFDDVLKTSLKNNSREWVKEFSWEKIIKKYIEIYNVKHD
ncbi:MAG: glycosyltransferase family 4 protein [Patescibacteria group bacterium]